MIKFCPTRELIPTNSHWAIIEFKRIFVPGDERSQSHPGHGYGDSWETLLSYWAYDNEIEWKSDLAQRVKDGALDTKKFVAMKVIPADISFQTVIDITYNK